MLLSKKKRKSQSLNCVFPLTSSVFGPYGFGWALLSILIDFVRQEHCGKWGKAKQSALRIWGAELIKTSFEEQRDAPNVSSMMGMQVFMLRQSLCRLHYSPQMLFSAYLSFHSYSLNLHFPYPEQSASVNSVSSHAVLFSLYWYLVPQKCREMTVPLSFLFFLSWDDSSSVSSGISDTLDTDDLNTSSSLSSYVNTPSVPHRDVDEQVSHWYRASWSTESETSAEVHMRNNFKTLFSFHL